jgi:hypothetical protein
LGKAENFPLRPATIQKNLLSLLTFNTILFVLGSAKRQNEIGGIQIAQEYTESSLLSGNIIVHTEQLKSYAKEILIVSELSRVVKHKVNNKFNPICREQQYLENTIYKYTKTKYFKGKSKTLVAFLD